MALLPDSDGLLVEGFYGMPPTLEPGHGPDRGSVEWLLNAVQRHSAAEAAALAQYELIATDSGDPVVALVMRLILDDEQRHHGLLQRIEASLRDALNWSHSASALPSTPAANDAGGGSLATLAHELIDEEHTGARKMRELAQSEKNVGGGLHSLLLEMMAMDSDKHARLLRFVEERLGAREHHR
jgi:hypothetical protein